MHRVWGALLAGIALAFGLAVLLAPAAPAEGQSGVRVCGSGYGHGVGMSQWGALGRAQAGQGYALIIRSYYAGTQVRRLPDDPVVRVLLGSGSTQDVTVRPGREGRLINRATGGQVSLEPGTYRVRYLPDRNLYRVVNVSAGRAVGSYRGPLVFQPASGGPLGYGSRDYRGALLIQRSGSELRTVNRLRIEAYIRGVVPLEMPPSWHQAALRAQAVAARSFARASLKSGPYDLTTGSMVYGGASAETPATNRAVSATARVYALYDGRPITAFFSAANGGYSEDSRYVFNAVPYLKAIRDVDAAGRPFERRANSPWMRWSGTLSGAGLGIGTVTEARVLERTPSGRAMRVRVTGTEGSREISGQYAIRDNLRTTGIRLADGSTRPGGPLPAARIWFGDAC